jgi:hypothetical protein
MRSLQALLALFACAFLPLHAAGLDDLTWTTTGGEVTITNCDQAASGELVIPDTIEGNPVTSIGSHAFSRCSSLTSITMGDSVTSIGRQAFFWCESLTIITIPDSVTSIGGYAFASCYSLTSINVGAGNLNYTDVNGVLFNKGKTVLLTYPEGKTGANYTIPDSVTSIGDDAFYGCSSLTSITIPDSVTSIGVHAFFGCSNLTSIIIGNGVTSIGEWAFRFCRSLTSITFLGTAPIVGADAFSGAAEGATAYVDERFAASFGTEGSTWAGLTVAITRPFAITACGFANTSTFFIEFEPAGTGYRVMSSSTLDFGNAVEVTPTLQPTSAGDNRFEFTASGSRNFYRLEPIQ